MTDYKYLLTLKDLQKLNGADQERGGIPEVTKIRRSGNQFVIPPDAVRQFLESRGISYRFRVVTHANLKGGIGKTTSAVSFATRAAQYGFKTCILDLDPQGSASLALDCNAEDDEAVFYDIWPNPDELLEGALKHVQPNLAILPSSLQNSMLDSTLLNPANQRNAVGSLCSRLRETGYDLVVVDCPPSLGAATISAICASDTIIIPISSDCFSFKGLSLTLSEVQSICATFGLPKPEIKVLFSRYDRRESSSMEAIQRLRAEYGDYLLPIFIRTSTEIPKALSRCETVFASGVNSNPREDYDLLTRALLNIRL